MSIYSWLSQKILHVLLLFPVVGLPGFLPFGAAFPIAQRLAFRPLALGSWCRTVQAF
jgi:hypothetical protein